MWLLRRLPAVRALLWLEWQAGYNAGFKSRPVAEDLARFYNISADEARERLRSAMRV